MILVLGGTTEGRQLAKGLQEHGLQIMLTTVSKYGGQLAFQEGVADIRSRALTEAELIGLINEEKIRLILDATHPYATQISEMALKVSKGLNISYLRYERPGFDLPKHDLLIKAQDYQEAAHQLISFGKNVFLSIGSRRLSYFCDNPDLSQKRIMARVLPEVENLQQCKKMGLKPNQIIAIQGPFSKEANLWMFKYFQADVVVTKESGKIGGFWEKWEACLELGIPLIVITRPRIAYPQIFTDQEELIKHLQKNSISTTLKK